MSKMARIVGSAWPAQGMTEEEKTQHLANAPARADDATAASRAFRRSGRWLAAAGAAALVVSSTVLALHAWTWKPAEPVYARIDSDGRVTPLIRAIDAPQSFSEGTAKQYLRMYLDTREPYRHEVAQLLTTRCALLLSPEQQERYAREYAAAEGPRAKFGRTGSVSVADNVTYTKLGAQGGVEVWSMRFSRIEALNQQVACRPWQTTVTFAWRPDLKMSDADRTWNLAGMQILDRVSQPDPSTTRCF